MSRVGRVVGWVLLGCLLALLGFASWWRVQGGRVERVETPSMGTVAPVGSLLWIRPTDPSTLRPGDFITFHPPGVTDRTYSHRVREVYADGTIGTQGELSAPDPWRLQPSDVVGEVAMTWPGAGWLVRAAPLLALGGFAVALVTTRVPRGWRSASALVGTAAVLAVAVTAYRPFTRAEQLSFGQAPGGARATYVSTGLLPVRLSADGGGSVVLSDGESGTVEVPATSGGRRLVVHLSPAVPWPFWVVLVGLCLAPAAVSSVVRRRPDPTS